MQAAAYSLFMFCTKVAQVGHTCHYSHLLHTEKDTMMPTKHVLSGHNEGLKTTDRFFLNGLKESAFI